MEGFLPTLQDTRGDLLLSSKIFSGVLDLQNLVDSLAQRFQDPIPLERHAELNTFVVFNKRRRVTSSAKRKRVPGSTVISQTPDGSFLDLMQNGREVLQRCGYTTPEVRRC